MIHIRKRDKQAGWLTIDLRVHDDDEIDFIVVIPTFGPDHHTGMDCWCHPAMESERVIVHNEAH